MRSTAAPSPQRGTSSDGHAQVDSALAALHRPGDRAAGGDGVHPQFVAERGGAQHDVRIAHPAERAKREEGLVLQPRRGLRAAIPCAVVVLAADGAGGAGMLAGVVLQAQRLAGDRLRLGEVTTGEIARWQQTQAIEESDIGDRADLAVLGGRRSDAARGQVARQRSHGAGIGRPRQAAAAHRDRLQPLGAHHGAGAGAPRQTAVVGDRRVADPALTGGADRRHPECGSQLGAQPVRRLTRR